MQGVESCIHVHVVVYLRQQQIDDQWAQLEVKLNSCKKMLSNTHDLMAILNEMNACQASMAELEVHVLYM